MTLLKALDLMRKGSVMVREHSKDDTGEYFIAPGGPVSRPIALKIIEHPQVRGGRDGMWPGHEQTWRIT